ncbi:inositol monophosphatase family protein [Alkalicoccus chagannorensis]|uniref:inositol monophosphatase family protein n=1 Tax=Alkalicoccus chagannorensis TaxID=427072 RepID=UPI0004045233|nr:inositol monophosphatase family protein [Alkalicoccus chagannorensis]
MDESLRQAALQYISEAAAYIRTEMKKGYDVDTKANKDDLVTTVDKNVETMFQEKLAQDFPEHRLMGEEGSFENIHDLDGTVWILDPIDGTVNFVHMGTGFAVSLGIFQDGEPVFGVVYDVMNDELFTAVAGEGAYLNGHALPNVPDRTLSGSLISFNTGWVIHNEKYRELVDKVRGTRSYGSAALELAYVAAGRIDAYLSLRLAPWDVAGGSILVQEARGLVTNLNGEKLDFLHKDSLFAAAPTVYRDITNHLNGHSS